MKPNEKKSYSRRQVICIMFRSNQVGTITTLLWHLQEQVVSTEYQSLWGFHTVPKGPEKGRCSHPRFQKGLPDLCHSMERVKVKVAAAKKRPQFSSNKGRSATSAATAKNEGFHPASNSSGQPVATWTTSSHLMQSFPSVPVVAVPPSPSTGTISVATRGTSGQQCIS
jgi:hypothetical protein